MTMLTWFIIGVVLLGIELINFGLVSIWFAIGAFITMFFTDFSLKVQIGIFVITSALFLFLIRRVAVKYMKGRSKELDRITSKKVKIESIKNRGDSIIYNVRLDGKYWEAVGDYSFNIGDIAIVKEITGNKLVLIPVDER